MLETFENHINKKFPFLKEKKLLIAISGGVDSVVLTHLLQQLNYTIHLAHCNFQLRGKQSDLDENFIKQLAKELNIDVFSTRFETTDYSKKNKLSTQIAARQLRYDWFNKLVTEHNFDYILTAHHADDNLETFLINLTRGTGLDGLTGIPEVNRNIVRPFLPFSRKEIHQYALNNDIKWREDASNSETKYLRNKIRHQILPVLKEINPNILKTHAKTTSFLKQSQQIVIDKTNDISKKVLSEQGELLKINITELLKLPNPKPYLYQLLKEYNFTEWDDVYHLIHAQSGKKIVTKSHTLLKDRDFLLLLPTNKYKKTDNQVVTVNKGENQITNPIHLLFENALDKTIIDINSIFVDKNLLNYPLIVRKWKTGDYFYPTGMQGKKKISKYFKDEKMSIFDKKNTWLLCSNDNKIIWIVGKRQDRRFLNSNKTTKLLRITNYKQPLIN